jgi:hypothetical protein
VAEETPHAHQPAGLLARPDFGAAATAFLEHQGLDVLVILSFVIEPQYQRELAVYTKDVALGEALRGMMMDAAGEGGSLQLSPLDVEVRDPPPGSFVAYQQGNTGASRKQVRVRAGRRAGRDEPF